MRARRLALLALGLVVLPACERGCAGRRALETLRGSAPAAGGGAPSGSTRGATPLGLELGGTDCSDGFARCTASRVEISRVAHLPHPCAAPARPGAASPEAPGGACTCPWSETATCASGCAVEGLDVMASDPAVAAAQLCRSLVPVARPPLPAEAAVADVCSEAGIRCRDGIVRVCEGGGRPSRVAAVCLHACEPTVSLEALDDGAAVPLDGALAILCRRPTAERR